MRDRKLAADAALAVVLAVIGGVGTAKLTPAWAVNDGEGLAEALAVVAALVLVGRRRWPLPVLGVVTALTSFYLVAKFPYGPILLSFMVAVYTVARYVPLRFAAGACFLALPVLLAHTWWEGGPGEIGIVPGTAWVVVPFAVGTTVGNASRSRAQQARKRADEERLRVAQEVHDIVGHGLSAITMQAEVALHVAARKPEQALVALEAISRTSREALDELRVTLGVVRAGEMSRAPLAGLARLDDLAARMTESGVRVSVEVTGEKRSLPTAVDLAAYRVVQEALTNVLRHTDGAAAVVRLGYEPEVLTVEVTDTGGVSPHPAPSGHGLAGMRERVMALGGSMFAGPGEGGFQVKVRLPLK